MFRIDDYTYALTAALKKAFGDRLLYVGLQGSYLRGDANSGSDIDIIVVIDEMKVPDLALYKQVLIDVGDYERSCGFICSRRDLASWNPLEICQLLHTTHDLHGKLADYVPDYSLLDVKNYVKLSIGNLYHEICHRYIHSYEDKNAARLAGSYKSVFFILQNMHYLETGCFIGTTSGLRAQLNESDRKLMDMAEAMRTGDEYDFYYAFSLLFSWCGNALKRADKI